MDQDKPPPGDVEKRANDGRPHAAQSGPDVDPIIGEAVGTQLKSLFDEFASESVPDRFLDLIGQLEKSEREAATQGQNDDPAKEAE